MHVLVPRTRASERARHGPEEVITRPVGDVHFSRLLLKALRLCSSQRSQRALHLVHVLVYFEQRSLVLLNFKR